MARRIEFTKVYDHQIKDVWEALTNSEALSEWLMPCDLKPIVGHKFQFKTKPYPGFNGIVDCEVLEVEHQRKLFFSWSGGTLKNTTVSFELTELGNKTQLQFVHSGFEGFFNKIIVSRILTNGWLNKILTVNLIKYLRK
jgi:uncharacterized protein YndB with AHSA1/START domain